MLSRGGLSAKACVSVASPPGACAQRFFCPRRPALQYCPVSRSPKTQRRTTTQTLYFRERQVCANSLLDQAWGTHINAQELATNIFSTSIIPYSAFLYYLTKSKKTPPLALFGFYFLLVFVFATIPAGVIALKVYDKSLANVDFLHGSAESMLTVTNLLIVLGLRQGVRQAEAARSESSPDDKQEAAQPKLSSQQPADAKQ